MAKKKNENYRDRKHNLLLYPDDPSHCEAMEYIHKSYDYASCLHDKDTYSEDEKDKEGNIKHKKGELKKEHYHYVIRFKDAKWRSAIAKELGIEERHIEQCQNINNSLAYLIHYNDSDKYQYSIEDVRGPLKIKLQEIIASTGVSEVEKVEKMINYIDDSEGRISYNAFVRFCLIAGCWDAYRRSPSVWHKVIEEHNFNISKHYGDIDKLI